MAKIALVSLDGSVFSKLDFSQERQRALHAIGTGKKIFWHLDLGFNNLPKSFSNFGQFQTLKLAIDHFKEIIWSEFEQFSHGLLLYKGPCGEQIVWDEEMQSQFSEWLKEQNFCENEPFFKKVFARNVFCNFLSELGQSVPDEIPLYVDFDILPDDILLKAIITHPAILPRFTIQSAFSWNTFTHEQSAVCFPPVEEVDLKKLQPYRPFLKEGAKLIPEELLTVAWSGLDTIYYSKECISFHGMRKLKGFEAAGGELVDISSHQIH